MVYINLNYGLVFIRELVSMILLFPVLALPLSLGSMAATGGLIYNGKTSIHPSYHIMPYRMDLMITADSWSRLCRCVEILQAIWSHSKTSWYVGNSLLDVCMYVAHLVFLISHISNCTIFCPPPSCWNPWIHGGKGFLYKYLSQQISGAWPWVWSSSWTLDSRRSLVLLWSSTQVGKHYHCIHAELCRLKDTVTWRTQHTENVWFCNRFSFISLRGKSMICATMFSSFNSF